MLDAPYFSSGSSKASNISMYYWAYNDGRSRQKNTVNPTAEILHSHQCQIKRPNIVFVYERKSQMATLYAPVIMPVGNRCKEATGRRPASHRTQLLALKLLNSCSNEIFLNLNFKFSIFNCFSDFEHLQEGFTCCSAQLSSILVSYYSHVFTERPLSLLKKAVKLINWIHKWVFELNWKLYTLLLSVFLSDPNQRMGVIAAGTLVTFLLVVLLSLLCCCFLCSNKDNRK